MNHQNGQATAKIYQFPTRGRFDGNRRRASQEAGMAQFLGKTNAPIYAGAWYHDAAIKDDEPGRKR